MDSIVSYLPRTDAPRDRPCETIDVRLLPSTEAVANTLGQLEQIGDGIVLAQVNNRRPEQLAADLTDRSYEFDSIEFGSDGEDVLTVIWHEQATQ